MTDFAYAVSLRRSGLEPEFLAGDRSPGVYREFLERWILNEDGTRTQVNLSSPNVDDPNPVHGFFETGRRFQLFDHLTVEFMIDVGLGKNPMPGMFHVTDPDDGTVYRFRPA